MNDVNMNSLVQVLIKNAESNPQIMQEIQNNQMKRGMWEALKSGDAQRGEQLARNFSNSCGMTPQQMFQRSLGFFQNRGK